MRYLVCLLALCCFSSSSFASGPCGLVLYHTGAKPLTLFNSDKSLILWQNDPSLSHKREFRSNTTCLNDETLHVRSENEDYVSRKQYQNTTDQSGHMVWLRFPEDFIHE